MNQQNPNNYQPILTKLENNNRPKKVYFILGSIILILIAIIAILIVQKNKTNKELAASESNSRENTSRQATQTETQTEDPYAFIYETTAEPTVQRFDENGQLLEDAAFTPEEIEKVQKFFGPLPEKTEKSEPEHEKIRGIYVYDIDNLDTYLELVEGTEVNAFIIDIKEIWGIVYESKIPLARETGAIVDNLNLAEIFAKCHSKGIRVIARIVCFKDATLAATRPDLCIVNDQGKPIEFPLESNSTFANPYDPEIWQYLIDIAKEVIEFGADEIQFDYVRFPAGGSADGTAAYYGTPEEVPEKFSAVNRFLQTAAIEIQNKLKTPVGADLFSIIMTSEIDGLSIGQNFSLLGLTGIDNICPMIYPSHYANASLGSQGNGVGSFIGNGFYEAPDLYPYEVVANAIVDGSEAMEQEGYAHIRPYLQAFTASYLPEGYYIKYGGEEVRAQIDAAYDAGFDEWILWNPDPNYPEGSFLPKDPDFTKTPGSAMPDSSIASPPTNQTSEAETPSEP